MAKILFVHDETVRYALCKYLRRAGHDVTEAADGAIALKLVTDESFDLIVTDIIMPEVEGVELVMQLREMHPALPVIAISSGGRVAREEYLSVIKAVGASATLAKSLDPEEFLRLIDQYLSV